MAPLMDLVWPNGSASLFCVQNETPVSLVFTFLFVAGVFGHTKNKIQMDVVISNLPWFDLLCVLHVFNLPWDGCVVNRNRVVFDFDFSLLPGKKKAPQPFLNRSSCGALVGLVNRVTSVPFSLRRWKREGNIFLPLAGVEPALPIGNQILNLARLPIPPQGLVF